MKRGIPYFVIALVCIIAFRQVAFLQETLKYDILDGYLPGHYFISDCLRNNIFPLWNPYQQLGYPIFADMLNTNYIVDMFIGRLFPYTNITFHILFTIYVIIAGVGAYKLAAQLGVSRELSLISGIAYSLSGFITGNAQHIQFIIGAAWLPFCILYFLRLYKDVNLKNSFIFSIFTTLLITGGYPSFAIMLAYGLFPVFIVYFIRLIRLKNYSKARYYFIFSAIAAVLIALLCSGVFISIAQVTPYVERYVSISYDYAITNPFTPAALVSVISPLLSAVRPELFDTDISMNNHYFGIFVLILFIYALSVRMNRAALALLITAFVMLLFTFGEHAFLHRIFFEHVPLFDKFRHPSSFRFITIILILLFTGLQVTRFNPAGKENFMKFRKVYLAAISVLSALCFVSALIIVIRITRMDTFGRNLQSLINDFGIYGPLFIQSASFLLISFFFTYIIILRKKTEWFYNILIPVIAIEAMVFTGFNMRYTVTAKYDPFDIRAFLKKSPAGFPLPDDLPVIQHTEESVEHMPIINNTNTYAKSVSPYYMYPFVLDGFTKLQNDSLLFERVTNNRLLFFENKDSGDTVICKAFSPARMEFTTHARLEKHAVLLQNNYPGWIVKIDNQVRDHRTVYKTLIGIDIPPGVHDVVFEFRNPLYIKVTLCSFGLFILVLLLVQYFSIRNSGIILPGIFRATLIIIGVMLALIPREPYSQNQTERTILENLKEDDQSFLIFNTESHNPFSKQFSGKNSFNKQFRSRDDIIKLWNILDTIKSEKLIYVWANVLEPAGIRDIMLMHFPKVTRQVSGDRFAIIELAKDSTHRWYEPPCYLNNYEISAQEFTSEGIIRDSTNVFSGLYSEKLTGEKLFSSTFRKSLDGNRINVFAQVRFMKPDTKSCHLVITITRKNKTLYYEALDLENFNDNDERWNTGFMSKSFLKSSIRRGDELVVYCWNSGNNRTLYLDDFFVKVN